MAADLRGVFGGPQRRLPGYQLAAVKAAVPERFKILCNMFGIVELDAGSDPHTYPPSFHGQNIVVLTVLWYHTREGRERAALTIICIILTF